MKAHNKILNKIKKPITGLFLNKFVTARTKFGTRQGWVIDFNKRGEFVVKGESGQFYICKKTPVIVENPPKRTV